MQTQQVVDGGNSSRASFLEFYDAYDACDAAVAEAVGERKDLRARIKGAGFNLAAFDRARKEALKSGDKRDHEDREYRRNMEWLGKPIGFQSAMFREGDEPPPPNGEDTGAVAEHQRKRVHDDGLQAGKDGMARDNNPWSPGTLLYQDWDTAWVQGAEQLARSRAPEPGAKRGRGRPPGSRNKPKPSAA